MNTPKHIEQELKKFLDTFGFDAGGYKVTLELWGDQQFDCGLDQCPDHSTGHRHARKIEFSRLSKDFAGDVK